MQTFLPFADFDKSAAVLDNQRLNKQRVECKQIIKALLDPEYGWQNHPATKMWRGHGWVLIDYAMAIHRECDKRGIRDRVDIASWFLLHKAKFDDTGMPPWLGDERVHRSHRSNLKRKAPVTYYQFEEADDLPYYWPV